MPQKTFSRMSIQRSDPSRNIPPTYQTYEVPLAQGYTVMDALLYIHCNMDGSLAFRRSCQCGLCLVCLIQIDGKTRCPCKTYLHEKMVLAPVPRRKIIKDLVVDMDKSQEKQK